MLFKIIRIEIKIGMLFNFHSYLALTYSKSQWLSHCDPLIYNTKCREISLLNKGVCIGDSSEFQCYAAYACLKKGISVRELSLTALSLPWRWEGVHYLKKLQFHWQMHYLFAFIFIDSRKYLFNCEIQLKWVWKIKQGRTVSIKTKKDALKQLNKG